MNSRRLFATLRSKLVRSSSAPANPNQDAASAWLLILAGLLTSGLVAWSWCSAPIALTRAKLLPHAVSYLVFTILAGTLGVRMMRQVLVARETLNPGILVRYSLPGWIFLPAIVLLGRFGSLWVFACVAVAAIALCLSLRQLFPHEESSAESATRTPLQTLNGFPSSDARPYLSTSIALLAVATLIFAGNGSIFFASLLLALGLSLLTWHWTTPTRARIARRLTVPVIVFAFLLTLVAQLPWLNSPLRFTLPVVQAHHTPHRDDDPNVLSAGYVGIILLPPPREATEITLPPPPSNSFVAGILTKPLTIPFNGSYWYFKAPRHEPGSRAHLVHGRPTDLSVSPRSTDGDPLLMEAHQTLPTGVDPACCYAIDLTITNAETLPSPIRLGLRLSDSTAPNRPPIYFSFRELSVSQPPDETLRYTLPPMPRQHRFDQISIVYLPTREHSRRGVKVSIQSFTLIPR